MSALPPHDWWGDGFLVLGPLRRIKRGDRIIIKWSGSLWEAFSSAGDGRKVKQMSMFRSLGFFCMFAEMETLTKAETACELRNPLDRDPFVSKSVLLNFSFFLRCDSVFHPATELTETVSISKDSDPHI